MMESFSLSKLNLYIKKQLNHTLPELYWVVAEINEMHVNSGHCFLELIEKDPDGQQIIAKSKANIWAYQFRMLRPYFESITGQGMKAGLKVMLRVGIVFHELYGLSLQVTDINPAYTIGDLALQKQAVIRQLMAEGVIDMNKELKLSEVPQRIAVISSPTAAGYGDFTNQLVHNPRGYIFHQVLFPAIMQGNEAETSIIKALEQVFDRENEFDAVVVIRGGGSQSDLNCFNSYQLATCIAQFPIPVITGIGHDRDETVADLVACHHLKTPTAVAEFLIGNIDSFYNLLHTLSIQLNATVMNILDDESKQLRKQSQRLQTVQQKYLRQSDKELQLYRFRLAQAVSVSFSKNKSKQVHLSFALQAAETKVLQKQTTLLSELQQRFARSAIFLLDKRKEQIFRMEDKCKLLDPALLLKRGYSITTVNGKIVHSTRELKEGTRIETIIHDGKVASIIEKIAKDDTFYNE